MYKFSPGTTSRSLYFRLRDSTSGQEKTGLTSASAGATASYTRERGSPTAIALSALASPADPYSVGGFIEVSSSLAPGLYRVDPPNAAFASGVPFVIASLKFSGVIAESVLVRLETSASTAGAGAISWTITVTNCDTLLPLEDAEVWVSTDIAGTNVVAGTLNTDTFGNVTFFLDAGTYYLWVVHINYTGTNPTAFVVS